MRKPPADENETHYQLALFRTHGMPERINEAIEEVRQLFVKQLADTSKPLADLTRINIEKALDKALIEISTYKDDVPGFGFPFEWLRGGCSIKYQVKDKRHKAEHLIKLPALLSIVMYMAQTEELSHKIEEKLNEQKQLNEQIDAMRCEMEHMAGEMAVAATALQRMYENE